MRTGVGHTRDMLGFFELIGEEFVDSLFRPRTGGSAVVRRTELFRPWQSEDRRIRRLRGHFGTGPRPRGRSRSADRPAWARFRKRARDGSEREGRENAGEPCGDGFERGVGEVTFFVEFPVERVRHAREGVAQMNGCVRGGPCGASNRPPPRYHLCITTQFDKITVGLGGGEFD